MTSLRNGFGTGIALGVVLAVVFAVAIGLLPEDLFVDDRLLAALFAAQAVAAPAYVWVAQRVADRRGGDGRVVLTAAVAAALACDGLGIVFWPGLYGQDGEALTGVAATLLWAFAGIVVAGMLIGDRWARERAAA
jgi:hypothetical protein